MIGSTLHAGATHKGHSVLLVAHWIALKREWNCSITMNCTGSDRSLFILYLLLGSVGTEES